MPDRIVFDLDGTLIDRDAALLQGAEELLARLGFEAPANLGARVSEAATVAALARDIVPGRSGELTDCMLAAIKPRADVIAMLRGLRAANRLVLLTNGRAELQRRKLRAAGLHGLFDEVLISGELGFGKPDPRCFELAFAGGDAQHALVVGDDLERDILPAVEAGARTCWISRGRALPDGAPQPTMTCEFPELPRILTCQYAT